MKKPKLMFVISKSEIGGAQTWVRDQIYLLQSYFEIILVTNNKGWLSNVVDCNVEFIENLEGYGIKQYMTLFSLYRKHVPDTIISSSASAGLYSRLLRLFCSFKCVYVSHGWSCLYNGGRYRIVFSMVERFLSIFTDVIVCVSNNDYVQALNIIKISESKLVLIRNSVFGMRSKLSKNLSDTFDVLFVGRLESPKRPDLIIDSVNSINNDVNNKYNIKLTIVGDGSLMNDFLNDTYDNINFLGSIPNFNDFYKYDVFALTSDSEGLPMSALEAAASSVPLLLSNVGGCSELISLEHGNGILTSNSIDEIIKSLCAIFDKYESYEKGASLSSDCFLLESNKDKYIEVYS